MIVEKKVKLEMQNTRTQTQNSRIDFRYKEGAKIEKGAKEKQ